MVEKYALNVYAKGDAGIVDDSLDLYTEVSESLDDLKAKLASIPDDAKYISDIKERYPTCKIMILVISQYCPLCNRWETIISTTEPI